ncbi:MAG: RNA polymerase factor sigma-54 [Bacteroidales bacterium]|nr:RNA polymerase factor sigma-54 [Bacteroidales bacterium]MBO7764650.1 RNA polymerase factor sigma-54 [Bacteroidales bacterium]
MLKQGLHQKLQQGLSPLQIQTIKLLELPTLELEQEIRRKLEENPVLEESADSADDVDDVPKNISLSEYQSDDSTPSYKLYVNNQGKDIKPQYNTFSVKESFHQSLENQLGYSNLDGRSRTIAQFIIGSLDDDGYLRRDLESLSDDIAFRLGIETSEDEVERILLVIQEFEPVGVGARDLQECLLLQIRSLDPTPSRELAQTILQDYFQEFTKKHYQKITSKLEITEEQLKGAVDEIVHLNPRPGGQIDDSYTEQAQQIVPDFILEEKDGELQMTMPKFNIPELKVNKRYADVLLNAANSSTREGKEAATFVKQKLDSAKWFVEAIKQRHNTLRNTMNAIIDFQREFFMSGDEANLKPMVLKDIAEKTNLDISTISRVVSSKYIQTQFGIFSLKYFFSEGMMNSSGEEVSTREIKKVLMESIGNEDKRKPLTDEELVVVLTEKGYKVARRTVAKYREQLNLPIARLRKEL